MSNIITIGKQFRFEASHVLPKHPGKCSRLHGHSWVLDVKVAGPVNRETGFVMDYADLKSIVNTAIIGKLDHQHLGYGNLNEEDNGTDESIMGYVAALGPRMYPSSENLVLWVASELAECFPTGVQLVEISLDETCTSRATWRP